jgi:hypothetical protein
LPKKPCGEARQRFDLLLSNGNRSLVGPSVAWSIPILSANFCWSAALRSRFLDDVAGNHDGAERARQRPESGLGLVGAGGGSTGGISPSDTASSLAVINTRTLFSVNGWLLAETRCPWATARLDEFKKVVYDSKFTKSTEGMSFANSKRGPDPIKEKPPTGVRQLGAFS